MIVDHFQYRTEIFFHSNIIVDHRYRILGVIDWEGACTVPWELVEFPLFLETVPFPMDASWNYDENGEPLDGDTRQRWQERKEYVERVARVEAAEQVDDKLSATLGDQNFQNLAYGMRVYLDSGKLGFYHRVIEPFEMKTVKYKAIESYLFADPHSNVVICAWKLRMDLIFLYFSFLVNTP